MSHLGRVFRPEEFEGTFRKIFEDVGSQCQTLYGGLRQHMKPQWRERNLIVQIVDDNTLNAWADSNDRADYVRVSLGAIERIYGTAYGLCSTPTFLPDVGNSSLEIRPSLLPLQGFPRMPLLRSDGTPEKVFTLIPNDPTRNTIAMLLAAIAIEFMLYHEIGHIVGGHLELTNVKSMAEVKMLRDQESGFLSRILECDADVFACDIISAVDLSDSMSLTIRELAPDVRWGQLEFALLIYCTALGMLFRMFYHDAPSDVASSATTHPHPAVRSSIVCSYAFARIAQKGKLDQSLLQNITTSSIRNIEEVWEELLLPGQRLKPLQTWAIEVAIETNKLLRAFAQCDEMLNNSARLRRAWSITAPVRSLPKLPPI